VSLVRHSVFTVLTHILVQFFGILTGVIMARILGPEGRGVYALYYTNALLLTTFCSFSFNIALVYFIPSGKFSPEKMLGLSFIVNIISSLISVIIILASYFSQFKTLLFSDKYMSFAFLAWLIIYTITSFLSSTYTSFFQATKQFSHLNKINLISSIISLLLFILLWFGQDICKSHVGLSLLILFVAQVVGIIIYAYNLHLKLKVKPSFKFNIKQDFKGLKEFLIAAHLSIVANFFNYRFSTWIIHYYINEAALGLYSLAINSGGIFLLVTEPLSMVLTPYLSSKKDEDKLQMFYSYFRILFWTILMAAIVLLFLAPIIFPWVYGNEFYDSVLLFQILIPGFVFSSMTKILASFVISSGKQKYNLYATLVGLSITLIFNFILVKNYYEVGAVMANLLTYFGIFICLIIICNAKLKLNIKKLFSLTLSDIQLLKTGIKNIRRS